MLKRLSSEINTLKTGPVGVSIRIRISEFESLGQQNNQQLFKELCFCLLTANYTSEGGIKMQKAIGDGFLSLPESDLALQLRLLGYRFPNARARYIAKARTHLPILSQLAQMGSEQNIRSWFADNVLGLGYKEASHFLRNIGYKNVAIIDFHILDLLVRYHLIERPKTKSLSRKKYLEVESLLNRIACDANVTQGELDLYLWYMETGKILK